MSRMVRLWSGWAPASQVDAMPRSGEDFDSSLQVPFPHQQIIGVECGNDKDWNPGFFQRDGEGCNDPDFGKIQSAFHRQGTPSPTAGHTGRNSPFRADDRQFTTCPGN